MPYIKQEDRKRLDEESSIPLTAGELNYHLTQRCIEAHADGGIALQELAHNLANDITNYMLQGDPETVVNYETFNSAMGALDCCRREWHRRMSGRIHTLGPSRFWEIVSAIERTANELYATQVAPYEDTKIQQNGDVYA